MHAIQMHMLQTKKGVRLSILHLKTIHGVESSPIFYERRPCLSEKAHIESRHEKSHKNNRRIRVLEAANRPPQVATRQSHRHWRRHYMAATYNKSLWQARATYIGSYPCNEIVIRTAYQLWPDRRKRWASFHMGSALWRLIRALRAPKSTL